MVAQPFIFKKAVKNIARACEKRINRIIYTRACGISCFRFMYCLKSSHVKTVKYIYFFIFVCYNKFCDIFNLILFYF